ncbi:T9SS type B sorting domain-containing protein [Lacinutrix sp. WUR7]|uniref:T9SS type B sorting domain-containing protein n=1 Tax=Lacinutrix sp. WUR7 TaxID=2653681 RepID=UPI00193DA2AC|nr:choice-of-anchor L domain-containing protein [Lacinutrix sp. WUR7]QRM90008.1 T9SS type B sorting domain-containing protein [Lacinutrix sp. WUR7]
MRKIKNGLVLFFMLLAGVNYAQIISINDASDPESNRDLEYLVRSVLISGDCAVVGDFSEQVFGGPSNNTTKSYGYFTRPPGNTSFPFSEGIILSTGRAFPAGNTASNVNNDNQLNTSGDADLENALGIAGTADATFIKFNFSPTSSNISFRYLMASEEYNMNDECTYADSFAFLLREVGSTNYINLALIPGTTVPVSTINVRPNVPGRCSANNPGFFEGYNLGDTNYGGRTVVLTASATVIPNATYEIKLVIADQGDSQFDSAVFLEAGSFVLEASLGLPQLSATNNAACGTSVLLDANIVAASYEWFFDNGTGFISIPGETSQTYNANLGEGIYKVEATLAIGCVADDEILVQFVEQPTAMNIITDPECDPNNDGSITVNLEDNNTSILNGQNPAVFEVLYFTDSAYTTQIVPPATENFVTTGQTIYARVRNINSTNCVADTNFDIELFDTPFPNQVITDLAFCDNNSVGTDSDGFIKFNLEDRASEILMSQSASDFTLTYFLDAAYTNQIPFADVTNFTNTVADGQTIYVEMTNNLNVTCAAQTSFNIEVFALPVLNTPVGPTYVLKQCDDDTDGITAFNLTEANVLISNNSINEVFTYYPTQVEAETGLVADQITNFTNYSNPTPLNSFVYSRIETVNNCYRVARIDLIVGVTQIPVAFYLDYAVCDDKQIDNDNTNGIATFDFSDATAQFEALFPTGQSISITYYTSLADALAENNEILDISNHRNDASPNVQNIFVRIDSDDVNACLGLGNHITLTVDALPEQNTITNYPLCSDTNSATYDLSTKNIEVIGAQVRPILISYHENLVDAQNNASPIVSPYLNNVSPRTIFVRAQFDDNGNGLADPEECFTTDMSFDLIINQNPIVVTPTTINKCNDVVNTKYDLTIINNEVTAGDNTIILTYFETQNDLNINNPIPDPTEYLSTILINNIEILATGANGCASQTTLTLNTILYDNLNTNPQPLTECEIDNDGFDSFDLTRSETEILNGLNAADFTFTYYEVEADAIVGNTMNITDFTNFTNSTLLSQTIYVRVQPISNDCFQVVPLIIVVNPVPEIDIEDQYVICLASDGSVLNAVNETFIENPPIDSKLSSTEFTFQWYTGVDVIAANALPGETQPTFNATSVGFYTVNATNRITGCTIPGTTEVVASYPPESITVDVLTNAFSDNSTFEVIVAGSGVYEYSLYEGNWQSSPIFENVLGGTQIVKVRDIYNCEELQHEVIIVDYPKVFTPNNDGYNDTWNILGVNNQLGAKIYIFNRYGELMKELSPSGPDWDGTFNGQDLPTSDYWFTVEYIDPINKTKKEFKSHFTLKR